mgnify:CR=1 FL=1
MNNEQYLYMKLSEESSEISKECMKIMQFGLDSRNPDTGVLFVLLDSSTNRNMREIMETIGNLFAGDIWEDAKKTK